MLNDLLNGQMPGIPNILTGWNLTNQQMLIVALFTAAATYVIVRMAAGVRVITIPVSVSVLFICAMAANWYLRDIHMSGITDIQKTMILTIIGHVLGGIVLLLGFRTERT